MCFNFLFQSKENIVDEILPQIEEITSDADIARKIVDAARSSMGQEFSEIDQVYYDYS